MISASLFTAFALMTACSSDLLPTAVPLGSWGGEHVALDVTSTGARVEFDCAHGTLTQPLTLDSNGQFGVAGTFTREGGPTPGIEPAVPATYSGRLQGTILRLTVTLSGSNQPLDTFTLAQGRTPTITKCK